MILGGVRDEYGCCISCGYSYCPSLAECLRPWERICPTQYIGGHRFLNKLDEFNLTELGVFIAGVCASLGALLVIIQKSKCKKINCCCAKCERDVDAIIQEEKLQKTGHTGATPRLSLDHEPEQENIKQP